MKRKKKIPLALFKYYDIFINGLLKPGKFIKKQVIKTSFYVQAVNFLHR